MTNISFCFCAQLKVAVGGTTGVNFLLLVRIHGVINVQEHSA